MKSVSFNENKNKVYVLITWKFAYNSARKKYWEFYAIDRIRFRRRIQLISQIVNPVLDQVHRYKIYKERFEI